MINQNWWFTTLLTKQFKYCPPLNKSIKCEVLIVGGGFSVVAFSGSFAARNILGDADVDYSKYYLYFSNRRHFALPSGLGSIIGKPALFSLTNSRAKFWQVDSHRKPVAMKDEF